MDRAPELPGSLARRALPPGAGQHGLYALIAGPLAVLLGLAAALAVDGNRRLRLLARTLIFHPVLLPTVAVAATWLFLLNPVSGPVATLITRLTGRAQGLLEDPATALATVALVAVYKNCGLYMLLLPGGAPGHPARPPGRRPRRGRVRSGGSSAT